jgi:hypothetical protein
MYKQSFVNGSCWNDRIPNIVGDSDVVNDEEIDDEISSALFERISFTLEIISLSLIFPLPSLTVNLNYIFKKIIK